MMVRSVLQASACLKRSLTLLSWHTTTGIPPGAVTTCRERERENKISGVFRFYTHFFVAIAKWYGVAFMNVTKFQPFSIPCLNYTIFHC